jgi:hypothetical protein
MVVGKVMAHLCLALIIWRKINNDKRRRDTVVGNVVAHLCLTLVIWIKINNDKRRRDMVMGKMVAHLCLTLIIWKTFNKDKRRRDMVMGKVVAHLCLTCTPGFAPIIYSPPDTLPTYPWPVWSTKYTGPPRRTPSPFFIWRFFHTTDNALQISALSLALQYLPTLIFWRRNNPRTVCQIGSVLHILQKYVSRHIVSSEANMH